MAYELDHLHFYEPKPNKIRVCFRIYSKLKKHADRLSFQVLFKLWMLTEQM